MPQPHDYLSDPCDLTDILAGSIDVHVHAGPHLRSSPRRLDPIQAAQEARDAGMRAIVYMDVFEMSNGTSWLVNRAIPDFQTYGGLIMNTIYGGMNPRAVKTALEYGDGAKFISFGAHSTYFKASTEGRFINNKAALFTDIYPDFASKELSKTIKIPLESPVSDELDEILTLIHNYPDVYLLTGHVSGAEAIRLVDLANHYGINNILVSGLAVEELTLEQQSDLVAKGAFLERSIAQYIGTEGIPKTHYYTERAYMDELIYDPAYRTTKHGGLQGLKTQIETVGAEHIILSSDYGVRSLATPVEGMRQAVACLLDLGISTHDIRKMICVNPARLLGLT